MSYFSDLGLAEPILRALAEKGYADPTPIQRQAIPALIEGRDILGLAQTGTGKTAAFALPSLHRLAADRLGPAAGVMTPQGIIRRGLRWARGDDLLGSGFQIWALGDVAAHLAPQTRAWLEARQVALAVFGDPAAAHAAEDTEGVYTAFLRQHGVELLIVRPDFFAFGGGALTEADSLVADLARQLHAPIGAALARALA